MNAEQLIARNIAAHTVDGCIKPNAVQYEHERTIRQLADEVNRLNGDNLQAANGCVIFTVPLGDSEVSVEFEVEAAEGDGWEEPRYGRGISATQAFIGGAWVSASAFQLHITEQWEAIATDLIDDEGDGHED